MSKIITRRVLSLLVVVTLILQQTGFAQGIGQLDISRYIGVFSGPDKFRPLLLRYFSYDPLTDNFQVLLDKGSQKGIKDSQLKEEGQELLKYFLVGIALPDENFWVNLRPDSEDKIIEQELASTDLGRVLLEADLQLKKDVAKFTSPETPQGRDYWNKLYEKAGQIFSAVGGSAFDGSSENITIPTLTRPWIVPGEVIIRENAQSAYVYKATLKVMLEQDHLKNSADYNFSDPRLKELNEYSSQLIRQNIIPELTKEVNSSARYASLRQVFSSLILSRWFKSKFTGKSGRYSGLINSANLTGLTSKQTWSKTTYFKEYQNSFAKGEYNVKEQVTTLTGPVIRTYFSGGIAFQGELNMPTRSASSSLGTFSGKNPIVTMALGNNMINLAGDASNGEVVPGLTTKAWAEGFASSPVTSTPLSEGMAQFQLFLNANKIPFEINFQLDDHGNNAFTTEFSKHGFTLNVRGYEENLVDPGKTPVGRSGIFQWSATLSAELRFIDTLAAVRSVRMRLIPKDITRRGGQVLDGTLTYKNKTEQLEGSLNPSLDKFSKTQWSITKLSGPYRIELELTGPAAASSPAELKEEGVINTLNLGGQGKQYAQGFIDDVERLTPFLEGKARLIISEIVGSEEKIRFKLLYNPSNRGIQVLDGESRRIPLSDNGDEIVALMVKMMAWEEANLFLRYFYDESPPRFELGVSDDSEHTVKVRLVPIETASSPMAKEIFRDSPLRGQSPLNPGGIDFRVIPMITQPMGNLSGLSFSLPKLSNVENINLDKELAQIQNMLQAGITPSGERLKEFVAACYQKGELKQHLDGIVALLKDTCELEEEKVDVTSNAVKEVMLILDSIG